MNAQIKKIICELQTSSSSPPLQSSRELIKRIRCTLSSRGHSFARSLASSSPYDCSMPYRLIVHIRFNTPHILLSARANQQASCAKFTRAITRRHMQNSQMILMSLSRYSRLSSDKRLILMITDGGMQITRTVVPTGDKLCYHRRSAQGREKNDLVRRR